MPRRLPLSALFLGAMGLALGGACAQLIGADFDVRAASDAGAGEADSGDAGAEDAACGRCVITVADHLDHPFGMAARDGYVYWAVNGGGTIMRARAGETPEVLASGQAAPNQVFVDASHVYWTNDVLDGGVFRMPTDGTGGVEELAAHQKGAIGLTVDGHAVYWTTADGRVMKRDHDAGSPDGVAYAGHWDAPGVLIRDETHLYFTELKPDGGVHGLDIATGTDQLLAQDQVRPAGLALAGEIYFATLAPEGAVTSVDTNGNGLAVFAPGQDQPAGVVTDGEYIYWTNFGDGTIRGLERSGGTPVTLAAGQDSANGIAVDDTWVYWSTFQAGGAVRKVRKLP